MQSLVMCHTFYYLFLNIEQKTGQVTQNEGITGPNIQFLRFVKKKKKIPQLTFSTVTCVFIRQQKRKRKKNRKGSRHL